MGSCLGRTVDPENRSQNDVLVIYISFISFQVVMSLLDNSQRNILDLPSFESASLDGLKQHLSICIRAIQPLTEWGPRLQQRKYTNLTTSPQEIAEKLLESPFFSFRYTILDLFRNRKNRLEILSSEDISLRIFSLILQVPWQQWAPVGKTVIDQLEILREFKWEEIPSEWDVWRPAIKVLDLEAKWILYDEQFKIVETVRAEPFTDAGVKFIERDEHFWWAEPQTNGEEKEKTRESKTGHKRNSSPVNPTQESVQRGCIENNTDSPGGWRGELFFWTAGGDCCA